MSKSRRAVPLERATRCLAPFVACHLIGFAEALDALVATACPPPPLLPNRLDIERVLASALAREVYACPPELLAKYRRHAAACARGVASVRELRDSHRPVMETPAW
jgi:hypothetical protein